MTTTRVCAGCGTEFTRTHRPSKPPKYCSRRCAGAGSVRENRAKFRAKRQASFTIRKEKGKGRWSTSARAVRCEECGTAGATLRVQVVPRNYALERRRLCARCGDKLGFVAPDYGRGETVSTVT